MKPEDLENLVVNLHDKILTVSGGRPGIEDIGLIKSAIHRPFAGTANGVEFYDDPFKKAAALTQSLCLNHGFVDGNKRTGLAMGMLFLFRQGYYIPTENPEKTMAFVLSIVNKDHSKRLSIEQIACWFREHALPIGAEITEDYIRFVRLKEQA